MNESKTINKKWFKNQLLKGNLLLRCKAKYSDDYGYDASVEFGVENEFSEAKPDKFDEWYVMTARIY
ncbi:MAG: hypothetical protein H7Z76_14615 [Methylotenera sp.]|nr:hypothetical protein [Flavobacterium sp.]